MKPVRCEKCGTTVSVPRDMDRRAVLAVHEMMACERIRKARGR
jgi:hypothetical protein